MTRSRNSRKAIVAERPGPHGCPTCCRALEKMLAIALQEIPPFNVDAIKRAIIEYFDADEAAEAAMGDAIEFDASDGHNCDVLIERLVIARAALVGVSGWKSKIKRQAPKEE